MDVLPQNKLWNNWICKRSGWDIEILYTLKLHNHFRNLSEIKVNDSNGFYSHNLFSSVAAIK